jgi:drug/metabolite transporter (DMT)-like permease
MNRYGVVSLIGAAAGSSIVFSRFALAEIQPTLLLTIRMAIAFSCFVIILAVTRTDLRLEKRIWFDGILVGLLAIGLPLELSFMALQHLSSGLFTVLLSFTGMATLLVAHFILADEPATPVKLLGAAVAFIGVVVLIATRSTGLAQAGNLRGYLFALGAVLSFSIGNVYARRRLKQVDSFLATAMGMGASLVISLPFTLLLAGEGDLGRISGWSWSAAIYSAVVGSFLYFSAVYWAIKSYGATMVGLTYFVTPVVSTLLGALLLGEIVTGGMIAGACFVLLGLVLVNRREPEPLRSQSAQ